jgi:hypothetical protein
MAQSNKLGRHLAPGHHMAEQGRGFITDAEIEAS